MGSLKVDRSTAYRWLIASIPLIVLFILFYIFRLPGLSRMLWVDELYSMRTLQVNLLENPLFFGVEIHQPIYFYWLRFIHVLITIIDPEQSIISYRILNAAISMLIMVSAYFAFINVKGKAHSFFFALFFAIVPLQIYYSQELRPYILLTLFVMLQLAVFGKLYRHEKMNSKYLHNPFTLYFLLGVLSLFTHLSAVFLVISYSGIGFFLYKDLGYTKRFNKFVIGNLLLILLAVVLMIITRINPMYLNSDGSFDKYVGGFQGVNLLFLKVMVNRFKEVLVMYYWNGVTYYIVGGGVQFVFKKVMLLLVLASFIVPFVKTNKYFSKFDRIVGIILVCTLGQVYITEQAGLFPFGGRYIMPFSVFLYYLVSNVLAAIFENKIGRVFVVIFIVAIATQFLFHEKCYYELVNSGYDLENEQTGAYKACYSKMYPQ